VVRQVELSSDSFCLVGHILVDDDGATAGGILDRNCRAAKSALDQQTSNQPVAAAAARAFTRFTSTIGSAPEASVLGPNHLADESACLL
jgi:hypothetical protein